MLNELDIFDPEIIYCINKIIIKPFISNKYLRISFGEELLVDLPFTLIDKMESSIGTIFTIQSNGGVINLRQPLTDISYMYYSYTDGLSCNKLEFFKKTKLINVYGKISDTIYISITEGVPTGSLIDKENKNYINSPCIKEDYSSSPKDEEIVKSVISLPNDKQITSPKDEEIIDKVLPNETVRSENETNCQERDSCCCITYILNPIYKCFYNITKKITKDIK